jgi:hypothetical protein
MAGMTASVVRFPESGAYPAALSEDDERVIALIRRSLAATRALDRDGVRLDEDESPNSWDFTDCSAPPANLRTIWPR